jgi:hypothetical protein
MGIGDKLKQGAEATRQRIEDGRHARREAEAVAAADTAEREREATERRNALYATLSATCPLSMTAEDEASGWSNAVRRRVLGRGRQRLGLESQKLVLTTKRVIYSRGRALTSKDQKTVYLTDIRDFRFHKPLVGFGTLTLETAGGGSIEALPAAKNGADVRNQLLTLIHWARTHSEAASSAAAPIPAPTTAERSVTETLKQLSELHVAGVLTQEEFEAKKADLLSRL